jgi:hypothetical protein
MFLGYINIDTVHETNDKNFILNAIRCLPPFLSTVKMWPPEATVKWSQLSLHMWDIMGSKVGLDIDYPD